MRNPVHKVLHILAPKGLLRPVGTYPQSLAQPAKMQCQHCCRLEKNAQRRGLILCAEQHAGVVFQELAHDLHLLRGYPPRDLVELVLAALGVVGFQTLVCKHAHRSNHRANTTSFTRAAYRTRG